MTIPTGITLQQIDGGPNYYANNGFTYALNAGWDNPSFFPIGPFLAPMHTQSDANRWLDLNWNTAYSLTGDSSLSLLRSNNISAILQLNELNRFGSLGPETVGILSRDEPSTYSDGVSTPLSTTPNSVQDGRFWWMNNTFHILQFGDLGGVPTSQVLSNLITTPNGTKRHIDAHSTDLYWFAGAEAPFWKWVGGELYNLGRDMTSDEMSRGSHYGDMVDWARSYQTTYSIPIYQIIETGGPYTENTSASNYITPPELNWAAWSSIIHGARGIVWFNHTFAGPGFSFDNLASPYYQTVQPGQTISIYDQVKSTNAMVEQLAPIINAQFALDYATVDGPHYSFGSSYRELGGLEVMVKYYNDTFYIFADTRESETHHNIPATFHINDPGVASVTVLNEGRTIPVVNGSFTDTFANAWTVHIYEVNYDLNLPPDAGSVSISDVTISEGNSGTKVATFTATRIDGTAAFDVNFATSDGTATVADGDYVAASGSLHFGANENTQTISVTINGDTKAEANEAFNVGLSNATNGATISDSQGVGTITNDDGAAIAGSVSINDVTISEGNSGTKVATLTVTRSGGTAAFDVNFATSDGTATVADSDYVAASGTLNFGANENTKTISVTIDGDIKVEANETFNVLLSNATNGATIRDGQSVGTISNDDGAGAIVGDDNADTLTGTSGDDTMLGLGGNDTLNGGQGNDALIGGTGPDTMTGGAGNDVFVYGAIVRRVPESGPADTARDTITDFVHMSDMIDLSAIDADVGRGRNGAGGQPGDQAFNFAGQNANVVAHSVTWFETDGNTIIQADVNGNTTADFTIVLTGTDKNLTIQDFLL